MSEPVPCLCLQHLIPMCGLLHRRLSVGLWTWLRKWGRCPVGVGCMEVVAVKYLWWVGVVGVLELEPCWWVVASSKGSGGRVWGLTLASLSLPVSKLEAVSMIQ